MNPGHTSPETTSGDITPRPIRFVQVGGKVPDWIPRKRFSASEESEPFDHPWRAAQVAATAARMTVMPAHHNFDTLRMAIEYSYEHSFDELKGAIQKHIGMLDTAQISVCTAYRQGIMLLRQRKEPWKSIATITTMSPRQAKHVISKKSRPHFDVLIGLTEPENYLLAEDAPKRLADELNIFGTTRGWHCGGPSASRTRPLATMSPANFGASTATTGQSSSTSGACETRPGS